MLRELNKLRRSITAPAPKPGETYIWDSGNPWETHRAEVIEVKDGWVLFWWRIGDYSKQETATVSNFNYAWRLDDTDQRNE